MALIVQRPRLDAAVERRCRPSSAAAAAAAAPAPAPAPADRWTSSGGPPSAAEAGAGAGAAPKLAALRRFQLTDCPCCN